MKNKFYSQFSVKEKRKIRESMKRVIELRKNQIANYENMFIRPLKDSIKIADDVLHNKASLQRFVEINNKVTERQKIFWDMVKIKEHKGDN